MNVATTDELVKRSKDHLTRKMGDAIIYAPDARVSVAQKAISAYVNRERLPSIAANADNVREGVLATYAAD